MGHEKGRQPVKNGLSEKLSRDLKKRGFKYLGPVVMYSHLQACGIINDHTEQCFRYKYIVENYPTVRKRRDNETLS
jgi:DNA-3-methyladenine glycosylase I